jgi:hypothetical protein
LGNPTHSNAFAARTAFAGQPQPGPITHQGQGASPQPRRVATWGTGGCPTTPDSRRSPPPGWVQGGAPRVQIDFVWPVHALTRECPPGGGIKWHCAGQPRPPPIKSRVRFASLPGARLLGDHWLAGVVIATTACIPLRSSSFTSSDLLHSHGCPTMPLHIIGKEAREILVEHVPQHKVSLFSLLLVGLASPGALQHHFQLMQMPFGCRVYSGAVVFICKYPIPTTERPPASCVHLRGAVDTNQMGTREQEKGSKQLPAKALCTLKLEFLDLPLELSCSRLCFLRPSTCSCEVGHQLLHNRPPALFAR